MSLPMPRRSPERSRGGWPRDILQDPVGEFAQLWNRMGRMFDPSGGGGSWVPTVEMEEAGDAYLVRAELPGMRPDSVDVETGGGELHISGETTEETRETALRRRHGQFAYTTTLPRDADTEQAEASMDHGVLTVRLPKSGQSRSRRIEVTSGQHSVPSQYSSPDQPSADI